jgi:hypothetical protein
VPKYDAFGREIGEDTFSGLGSDASDTPAPEAEAVPMEAGSPLRAPEPQPYTPPVQPPQPPQAQPQPPPVFTAGTQQAPPQRPFVPNPMRPPRRRRGGRGLVFVLLIGLFVFVAPLVCGGVVIFNAVDGASESVRDGLESTIKAIPTTTSEAPAVAPKGVSGKSLVRRSNFAAALAKLSGSELRLTHLRLAPERIDAQLLTRGGSLRLMQVKPGGKPEQLGPDSGSGFDTASTIPFSRLDPGAPQRLARRGARKLKVPVSTLQYIVPSLFSGKITWAAYFERSRYVIGDARGRWQRSYP